MLTASARQVRFPAMGTVVSIAFVGDPPRGALGCARDLFTEWERVLSRFRPDSELSQVNRAAGRAVAAGPILRAVLAAALRAARATDGVFDPALGCHDPDRCDAPSASRQGVIGAGNALAPLRELLAMRWRPARALSRSAPLRAVAEPSDEQVRLAAPATSTSTRGHAGNGRYWARTSDP